MLSEVSCSWSNCALEVLCCRRCCVVGGVVLFQVLCCRRCPIFPGVVFSEVSNCRTYRNPILILLHVSFPMCSPPFAATLCLLFFSCVVAAFSRRHLGVLSTSKMEIFFLHGENARFFNLPI